MEGSTPAAMKINGYSESKWLHAMKPDEAAAKIADILRGPFVWVGHNPYFDKRFIQYFLLRHLGQANEWKYLRFVDTRHLSTAALAVYYPQQIAHFSLDSIRHFLGWKVHESHDALTDARDSLRLFMMFCNPYLGRSSIS